MSNKNKWPRYKKEKYLVDELGWMISSNYEFLPKKLKCCGNDGRCEEKPDLQELISGGLGISQEFYCFECLVAHIKGLR